MEKVDKLKKLLDNYQLDGYLIPKNDEFFGEYVSEYKDNLKFISNFSGSYGFAIILKKYNYLFVDGRYTTQAKKECGKKFNIITIPKNKPSNIFKNKKLNIGFDPRLHTERLLFFFFKDTKCRLIPVSDNLVDKTRNKKGIGINNKFFLINNKDAGQSSSKKVKLISIFLKKSKLDFQFISAPENIAWLLNIRGQDSEFSPFPNSHLIISKLGKINLFCSLKKINNKLKKKLKHVKIIDIKYLDLFILKIKNKKFCIDSNTCSIYFKKILEKNNKIKKKIDPIYSFKSI